MGSRGRGGDPHLTRTVTRLGHRGRALGSGPFFVSRWSHVAWLGPEASSGVAAAAVPQPSGPSFDPKEPEADAKRGFGMKAALGATWVTLGAQEKASAFGQYLEDIGLTAKQVLGDLGSEEVEDVISFFYAGMPGSHKDDHAEPHPVGHETTPLPKEHWYAAAWEADEATDGLPHGIPHRAA